MSGQFYHHFMQAFLYESALQSFSLITIWLCDFLAKGYWQKSALKMLMKLATGEVSLNPCQTVYYLTQNYSNI